MKFLFVGYIFVWLSIFAWGMMHRDDVDKNGNFKFQWRFLLWFIMLLGIPFIAKFTGLV